MRESFHFKQAALLLAGAIAPPAFAQAEAKDIYVSGVVGAISVAGLFLIVGIYKLGKILVLKVRPTPNPASFNGQNDLAQNKLLATSEQKSAVSIQPNSSTRPVPFSRPSVASRTPAEEFWAAALAEFESVTRRPGLWARLFAEAGGEEAVAKAAYLSRRAADLQEEYANRVAAAEQEERECAREADLAKLSEERRAFNRFPKSSFGDAAESTRLLISVGCIVRRLSASEWEILHTSGVTEFARSPQALGGVASRCTSSNSNAA